MSQRFFSGRESWAFRAGAVDELCGHHASLIRRELAAGEHATRLLYSPRRDADVGPFGLRPRSGSHALALTDTRFIVSRDPHTAYPPPSVRSVPFEDIMAVEIGEALTLGWLVLRFRSGASIDSESVIFSSSGGAHFREAVRDWRHRAGPDRPHPPSTGWEALWADCPDFFRVQVAPLVTQGEALTAWLIGREVWADRGRARSACLAAPALVAVTADGVIIARSEAPPTEGTIVFGVDVTCVERGAVRRLRIDTAARTAGSVIGVDFVCGAGDVRHVETVRLGGVPVDQVMGVMAPLGVPVEPAP